MKVKVVILQYMKGIDSLLPVVMIILQIRDVHYDQVTDTVIIAHLRAKGNCINKLHLCVSGCVCVQYV